MDLPTHRETVLPKRIAISCWDTPVRGGPEDMLMNGEGNSSMEDVLARVQKAFESAFHVDPQTVTIDSTPGDIPAWDSMGHVELVSSLERAFGLSFDVDDLMGMENVKEICRIVQSKFDKVPGAQLQ
jgi:acyl carrier protein